MNTSVFSIFGPSTRLFFYCVWCITCNVEMVGVMGIPETLLSISLFVFGL